MPRGAGGLTGRRGWRPGRIHPRSALFYNKPPEGLEPGETSGAAIGLDSDHDIHQVNLKLEIPIRRSLTQRNPEIRAFVA